MYENGNPDYRLFYWEDKYIVKLIHIFVKRELVINAEESLEVLLPLGSYYDLLDGELPEKLCWAVTNFIFEEL